MIEGLQIQIRADELRGFLLKRVAYHEQKAAFYREQAQLHAQLEDETERSPNYTSSGMSLLQQERQKARDHRRSAQLFRFVAGHLIDDIYQLEEHDLNRFELLESDEVVHGES